VTTSFGKEGKAGGEGEEAAERGVVHDAGFAEEMTDHGDDCKRKSVMSSNTIRILILVCHQILSEY
jgi:hypothetical protein